MKIEVKRASLEDASILALLGRITFDESFGHLFKDPQALHDYYNQEFSVATVRANLLNENVICWLAYADDLPVGYAKLEKSRKTEGLTSENVSHLQRIYILKHFLHLKVGLPLLEPVIAETQALGSAYLWLAVWEGNERAKRFYEKHDFNHLLTKELTFANQEFTFDIIAKKFT